MAGNQNGGTESTTGMWQGLNAYEAAARHWVIGDTLRVFRLPLVEMVKVAEPDKTEATAE